MKNIMHSEKLIFDHPHSRVFVLSHYNNSAHATVLRTDRNGNATVYGHKKAHRPFVIFSRTFGTENLR
jgi:hypothetical protein